MFRGPGAKTARLGVFSNDSSVSFCDGVETHQGMVVPSYKHLGSVFVPTGSPSVEVSIRIGALLASLKQFSKVIGNSQIAVSRRLHILQAYIYSKGLFHSGKWPALTSAL